MPILAFIGVLVIFNYMNYNIAEIHGVSRRDIVWVLIFSFRQFDSGYTAAFFTGLIKRVFAGGGVEYYNFACDRCKFFPWTLKYAGMKEVKFWKL